jgi:transposase-like protein
MMDLTKARLAWVELYAKTRDAGLVCRRCGISRPTLRKWWRRYQADGEAIADCRLDTALAQLK